MSFAHFEDFLMHVHYHCDCQVGVVGGGYQNVVEYIITAVSVQKLVGYRGVCSLSGYITSQNTRFAEQVQFWMKRHGNYFSSFSLWYNQIIPAVCLDLSYALTHFHY